MSDQDDGTPGTPAPYRDPTGRFLPGNPGGPGRVKETTEAEYHQATARGCTVEDWERIVRRAVEDCDKGNVRERNAALAKYLLRVLFGQAPGALIQIANLAPPEPERRKGLGPESIAAIRRAIFGVYGLDPGPDSEALPSGAESEASPAALPELHCDDRTSCPEA